MNKILSSYKATEDGYYLSWGNKKNKNNHIYDILYGPILQGMKFSWVFENVKFFKTENELATAVNQLRPNAYHGIPFEVKNAIANGTYPRIYIIEDTSEDDLV